MQVISIDGIYAYPETICQNSCGFALLYLTSWDIISFSFQTSFKKK